MTVKEQVRQLVEEMPDDVSFDEFLDRVYVVRKIQEGLDDIAAGRTHTYDQIRAEFPRCAE